MKNYRGAGVIMCNKAGEFIAVFGNTEYEMWSWGKGHIEDSDFVDVTKDSVPHDINAHNDHANDPDKYKVTASREFAEETGLRVRIPRNAPSWVWSNYIYYFCEESDIIGSRETCPMNQGEILEVRWMSSSEIKNVRGNNAFRNFKPSVFFKRMNTENHLVSVEQSQVSQALNERFSKMIGNPYNTMTSMEKANFIIVAQSDRIDVLSQIILGLIDGSTTKENALVEVQKLI